MFDFRDESERKRKEKKTFVIPKVVANDWRVDKLKKMVEEGTATDEDKARLALMLEARGEQVEVRQHLLVNCILKSESFKGTAENGVADGSQVLAPTADASGDAEDPDYEQIPLHEFGAAFLRGYGWKQDEGIGKTNRRVVSLQVTKPRPKGLGLGAEKALKLDEKKAQGLLAHRRDAFTLSTLDADDESTEILPGSYVKIVGGPHKDRYGHVQSMDVDNSSCYVKLAIGAAEPIRVSQFVLVRVSKKDYEKHGKVLSKSQVSLQPGWLASTNALFQTKKSTKRCAARSKGQLASTKMSSRRRHGSSVSHTRKRPNGATTVGTTMATTGSSAPVCG